MAQLNHTNNEMFYCRLNIFFLCPLFQNLPTSYSPSVHLLNTVSAVQGPLQPGPACFSTLVSNHVLCVPAQLVLSAAFVCAMESQVHSVENAHSLPLLLEMSQLGGLGKGPGICL